MLNPKAGILKKLDRVRINDIFVDKFEREYAIFLLNLFKHHCPVVLRFPSIVEKPLIDVVKEERTEGGVGTDLGQILVKLKRLKFHMKQLNRKNSDLFERTNSWKIELKSVQQKIDASPFNEKLRVKVVVLKDYNEAVSDEE